MASVASVGTSPLSGYDDEEEAQLWAAVYSNSMSATESVNFMPSPTNNSFGSSSWAMIGPNRTIEASPPALSPSNADFEGHHSPFSSGSYHDQTAGAVPFNAGSVPTTADGQFLGQQILSQDGQQQPFLFPGELVFDANMNINVNDFSLFSGNPLLVPSIDQQQTFQAFNFENPQPLQSRVNVPPWEPLNLREVDQNLTAQNLGTSSMFVMEDPSFSSPSPPSHFQYTPTSSTRSSASPHMPTLPLKWEHDTAIPEPKSAATTAPIPMPIRKSTTNRVTKRKASPTDISPSAALSIAIATRTDQQAKRGSKSPSPSPSLSSSSSSSSSSSTQAKFLIVTPSTINAHNAQSSSSANLQSTNPYECFEALRPSQRGRKGPLATDTKQSALQVRRKGACFCCHARKVKCDMERPCRNCVKLCQAVPQAMCWQFPDFIGILFPEFIRGHFRKEEMTRFIEENIASFTINGEEKPCTVELFSGLRVNARLKINGKFFTAKSNEVLQHYHLVRGFNTMDLQARTAVPIGLGGGGGNAQKDELKRKLKNYIQAIVDEQDFAAVVTEGVRHTDIPRKVLQIVHDYSNRCDVPMVKRALSIYAMHFVLTRHLCLTPKAVADLGPTQLVPQHLPWVTPRVLNRQIKAVVDDMMCREMTLLFENFSKSLKPKLRKEWAPCLAAFLVLCLFMESVETAADTFMCSDNEISFRNHLPMKKRSFALNINREIENMPFKQFAFQFHQIYQTYSRDAATRSFNPLMDDSCFEQGELDRSAVGMVRELRSLIDQDDYNAWSELDFLTADPILPNVDEHPYPRDVSYNYTGRLVAKFLLSFQNEKYILDAGFGG
ncbi:hypothetical protein QBC38DRAFT_143604 [Podospora fimiseda]|uniref:Zn(2)-C6 fungal-type domain-containing protein n=1 Tax=Podospora fimiseda TaxID=252190 RepID=A0AAN7H882_9PEZI|nr:hypothetical protein QBC38DRAFT_143604 [Podospora fimiseda]